MLNFHSVELLRANDPSHMVHRIAPTPLLMTVAENDVLCPTDIALETYAQAREPKELHILPGGHFDGYTGDYVWHCHILEHEDHEMMRPFRVIKSYFS